MTAWYEEKVGEYVQRGQKAAEKLRANPGRKGARALLATP
jgi:hypothetical protein